MLKWYGWKGNARWVVGCCGKVLRDPWVLHCLSWMVHSWVVGQEGLHVPQPTRLWRPRGVRCVRCAQKRTSIEVTTHGWWVFGGLDGIAWAMGAHVHLEVWSKH